MKKTLNINIGNSIIHIEEEAYEMLTAYLNEVKAHFATSADHYEIVTDIENRIAEMFRDIMAQEQRQVVQLEDVAQVIAQMGTVKQFEEVDEESEDTVPPTRDAIKKLYRDTDDGIVAGVCAGFSHYLEIDVRWIRVIALISFFIGGSGILAYLIMWMIIPRAVSRSEKMYMKGEAVNLHGFIRNFEEELAGNQLIKRSTGFIAEVIEAIGRAIGKFGKLILKIIAGMIILFGCFCFLALCASLAMVLGFWDANPNDYFPFNIVNSDYLSTMIFAVFVSLAVPLIALILFSIRVFFNTRAINRTVSFALLIVWLAGIMTSIFYITKVSSEFKEHAEFTEVRDLKAYPTFNLLINRSRFFSKEDSVRYQISSSNYRGRVILNDDENGPFHMPRNVSLSIEKSDNGKITLTQNYSAQGKTFESALQNAQNIHYDFSQQDSVLNFSQQVQLTKNTNWRGQSVDLVLKVPVGVKLLLHRDFDRYLQRYGSWSCEGESDEDADVKAWTMTEDGLKCELHKSQPAENQSQPSEEQSQR
jgi:phage shock protein PspC (stress-responsive transcriptional regulator)